MSRQPTPEEIVAIHQEILEDFIKNSNGLTGMMLVGIRDTGLTTAVEVMSAAKLRDVYRGCASMLEAVLKGDERSPGKIENPKEAILISLMTDVLLALAGDDPEEVKRLTGEFDDFSKERAKSSQH